MPAVRKEDVQIKIPALIHLSRLGYRYLPRKEIVRDAQTNILPEELRRAAARLRGTEMPGEAFEEMMACLREALGEADLGRRFTRMLRKGWQGWPLLDFDRPERNSFLAATELPCASGAQRFQPDITLFVNGLPLAMIEVKTRDQAKGIRAEYDRARRRFAGGEFRRFLQAAQIWAFSNDRPWDPDRLLPTEGTFYATGTGRDFPLHAFQERHPAIRRVLRDPDPKDAARILADNGMPEGTRGRAWRRNLSPRTPTHQMLTGLFAPERFLFLLRYGLQYGGTAEEGEAEKTLLSCAQLFSLWDLREKIRRGIRNATVPPCGRAGEEAWMAAMLAMLRDCFPERGIRWILPEEQEKRRMEAELRARGIRTGAQDPPAPGETVLTDAAEKRIAVADRAGGPRIDLISDTAEAGKRLRNRLRGADTVTVLIPRHASAKGGNYTYLVECADGTLYCGWTNHLEERVRAHNEGRGAKYTRARRPVRLVYYEEFATREEAMSREWHMKRLSREEKIRLMASGKPGREEEDG